MDSRSAYETISLVTVSPEEVRADRTSSEIEAVYKEVFAAPPYNEPESAAAAMVERLQAQIDREGWRLITATQGGDLQGFAYGYVTRPGQWWHDRVARALDAGLVDRWFSDAFVLVEFAVRQAARGKGIGSRLHDAVLANLGRRTALTMTHQHDNPAVTFYLNRGWRPLSQDFSFNDGDAPRLILGRYLQ